jgi:hypothetical protein
MRHACSSTYLGDIGCTRKPSWRTSRAAQALQASALAHREGRCLRGLLYRAMQELSVSWIVDRDRIPPWKLAELQ